MSTDLKDALDALSKAHGPRALASAFKALGRSVVAKRRGDKQQWGPLASTFAEAMTIRDRMRADGATPADLDRHMEITLRGVWPQTREWHYLCADCDDAGWVFGTCVNGSCGRPFRLPGQAFDDMTGQGRCSPGHSFCRPCGRCEKGRAFGRQLRKEPRQADDAVETAARTTKPTRVGR